MKSFYEMMRILESQGYADDDAALALIDRALKKAGLPLDQDEFNVLYGKWADMTVGLAPNRTERVQGVILPEDVEQDETSIRPYFVGFRIDEKKFSPADIVEIHDIKFSKKYDDIMRDLVHEREVESSLKSVPY